MKSGCWLIYEGNKCDYTSHRLTPKETEGSHFETAMKQRTLWCGREVSRAFYKQGVVEHFHVDKRFSA